MKRGLVVLVALVGCGGPQRGSGSPGPGTDGGATLADSGSGGIGGSDGGSGLSAYPAGPYGNQIGDTLPNVALAGYRLTPAQTDSTRVPWTTNIQFGDYHQPACQCLVVTIGAIWCTACQQEQPQLVSDVAGDSSFCVLGVLQEGQFQGTPATRADVDTWTQGFSQNFSVAQGSTATDDLLNGFGSTIGLPFSFVVKPSSMKVLDVVQGFDPQIHANAMAECQAAPN
jgi:hypothetical protein